ncbi:Tissue factor pathway inhibitor 2 [Fasciola gigantica]|uniref:Tissue factor pathway inhibitor 2 n=1 Tax=Fasciola gigantica TaxID=46835 RepID=A0A504YRL2_FASGI|nr:Tissue factor pathway inhibitor 2 [Fasciola gigantica]
MTQFEMEGYRPVAEPEEHEPLRPVRHSPAPWAYRDTQRFGSPRHQACSQPLNRGVGPDEVSSWYFDTKLHVCRWFGYRGYGGNANRFYSRTACESLCIHDVENLCDTVKCSWPGTHCSLVGDQTCKHTEEMYGRDWQIRCPPDQPVCLSRRGTRIAPGKYPLLNWCFEYDHWNCKNDGRLIHCVF